MTNTQKQCLLAYLGYYTGEVDGLWGPLSRAAALAFQEDYGLKADENAGVDTQNALKHAVAYGMPVKEEPEDPWEGIRYFRREEFRCKCGKYCDGFPAEPSGKLLQLADRVREHFGAAAIVSSGVRCKTHNANVGGVAKSRHLSGLAMDFRIKGLSAEDVLPFVQAQKETRYAYDIDGTFIHMDVDA